jgi:hypothetical protein
MGLALATPHSASHSGGDGLPPGELVPRRRGASPRRMMAPSRSCQGIKCLRTGAGARVRGALERGGPCSRGERAFERGGSRSRGGAGPRARRSLLEVSVPPRTGQSLPEGGAHPRARRSLLEGIFEWAALVGRWGPPRCGPCPAWLGEVCLALLRVLSGDFPVIKGGP